MIKNNLWESLVWIVIWIFILSFIILWIANLLINSNNIKDTYDNKKTINILKSNTENVINNLDTTNVAENEIFYLFKNTTYKEFEIFTWSTNAWYKYIDKYWNKIDNIVWYEWDIYSRTLWLERGDNSLWKNHHIIKISINKLIK